jgi:hypothetical protein
MAITINASTSAGLVSTADTSGILRLQAQGTTVLNAELGKALALQGATSTTGCGIAFPATQVTSTDANTLDDYEEGTFTPTVIGSSSAGTATYSIQSGSYTKIGNTVNFWLKLSWTGGTGTGILQVSSLPFTPVVTNLPVMNVIAINITLIASNIPSSFMTGTVIQIIQTPAGGGSDSTVSYDAAGSLYITGTYPTT